MIYKRYYMTGAKQPLGFTLIEVVVSVALFSVIVLGAAQIFKMVISSQRSALATQNVQESLRYFLEVVSKEIRMAQKDTSNICGTIPPGEIFKVSSNTYGDILTFRNYYGQCVEYYLSQDSVASTTRRFTIFRVGPGEGYISPAKISIDSLHFVLTESSSTQPLITINLQAHATNEAQYKSAMTIQTSLSSRYYQ